jgi:D-alanyl-D-alanine carboxypeptidase (penicillin-binding protein 5/6)
VTRIAAIVAAVAVIVALPPMQQDDISSSEAPPRNEVYAAFSSSYAVYANESDEPEPVEVDAPENAKAVIAIDAVTGAVYCAKSKNRKYPVASTSKLMTVWLVLEKIAANEGDWSDKVKITDKKLEKMSASSVFGGAMTLKKGKAFTVKQLYMLTLIESNNAAAIQLGRWVAGTDRKFADRMNDAAKRLGMNNSEFHNACGLNNSDLKQYFTMKIHGKAKDTNQMSASDAATLAKALIDNYPEILKTSKLAKKTIKDTKIKATNKILSDKKLKKRAKGLNVDGLKTGYTRRAGQCLIATCKPDGKHRVITVVLDDKDKFVDTIAVMKDIYDENDLDDKAA